MSPIQDSLAGKLMQLSNRPHIDSSAVPVPRYAKQYLGLDRRLQFLGMNIGTLHVVYFVATCAFSTNLEAAA